MKTLKTFIFIWGMIFTLLLSQPLQVTAATRQLTESQKATADVLAQICIDNWDTYGVLPSVCIAQAFVESTLGKYASGNNLWGIRQGQEQYPSLEAGVMRYLEVINNGYYENALFLRDYSTQIKEILAGGYCVPVGDYYEDAIWIIENYDLDQYDKPLLDELARRDREEAQKAEFTLQYNDQLPSNTIGVNVNVVPEGSAVCIYMNDMLYGIYDIIPIYDTSNEIIQINNPELNNANCVIEVYEDAKG